MVTKESAISKSIFAMFVFLKYADNKQVIVNSNCAARILLNYIRTVCLPETSSCKFNGEIDLCDTRGNLIHLSACPPMSIAAEKLEERRTYIPVLITVDADGNISSLEALLIEPTNYYPEFNYAYKSKSKSLTITDDHEKLSKKLVLN